MCEAQTLLLVEDEPNLLRVLSAQLSRLGYRVFTVTDLNEAKAVLNSHTVHCVITDLRLPRGQDGLDLLKWIKERFSLIPVIIITAYGSVPNAVHAMKLGAFDYLTKPIKKGELINTVRKAISTYNHNIKGYLEENSGRVEIVGNSPGIKRVLEIIDKVADNPTTVLITGESGTGKELVARLIHEKSSRRNNHFAVINCAAIPSELLESELFGYEQGAFTGAVKAKPGRFELADKGSIFLDEIGEMPLIMQSKLLRVLQEGTFVRVGGLREIQVDVRIIAATNQPLEQLVKEGKFREDLYYRLNVVPIWIPPLRERKEDIPLLVEHIVKKFNIKLNKNIKGFTPKAIQVLKKYDWPGNIRELENQVERLMLFSDSEWIDLEDLPEVFFSEGPIAPVTSISLGHISLKDAVKDVAQQVEKAYILEALKQTDFNVTHAARLLMISRKTLQNKMKELGLREKS